MQVARVINTRGMVDTIAADELVLFATNDKPLYWIVQQSYIPNVARRLKNQSYDGTLAIKLWFYFAQKAAKKYKELFGGHFNTATLMNAAEGFRDYYHDEACELAMAKPVSTRCPGLD